MASSDVTALQRSDLNQFLFSDIGTEPNGTTLSVLSVFARRGADPWTEAARLADLSKADATDSLARMIAGMPKSLWALPDALVISGRLTGLLPSRQAASIRKVTRKWSGSHLALGIASVALIVAFVFLMIMQ